MWLCARPADHLFHPPQFPAPAKSQPARSSEHQAKTYARRESWPDGAAATRSLRFPDGAFATHSGRRGLFPGNFTVPCPARLVSVRAGARAVTPRSHLRALVPPLALAQPPPRLSEWEIFPLAHARGYGLQKSRSCSGRPPLRRLTLLPYTFALPCPERPCARAFCFSDGGQSQGSIRQKMRGGTAARGLPWRAARFHPGTAGLLLCVRHHENQPP